MSNPWDLDQYESQNETLKTGKQLLEVVSAEVKEAAAGNGQYINTLIKSVSDSGASFFKFNVINKNQQAVNIGMSYLKAIFSTAGITKLAFRDQYEMAEKLIGLRFGATVTEKEKDGYTNQNLSKFCTLDAPVNTIPTPEATDIPF